MFRNFISREAQRIEFGLATQMDQYEANMKVRQLLGEKDATLTISMKVSTSIKGAAFSLLNVGSSYRSSNHLPNKSCKGNNKSNDVEAPNELDEEDLVSDKEVKT
jgi:hypothetical protein